MVEENVRIKTFCPECGDEFGSDVERCPNDGTRLQEVSMPGDADDDPLLGEKLDGRFELKSILGEGGMGRVYSGVQLSVDRDVAVKVLRSELTREESIVKRFFREAKVISSFSHPNIVNLVEFGQDNDHQVLYLAMEYIDGHSLGDLLERGRLKPALIVEIAMQTAAALSEPHDRGIIHRDLKPENLMVVRLSDGRPQVKVVDFGIAHTLKQTQKLTQTGAVFGTPHYMAPEQAKGGEIEAHTDIYALGVILYEMVSGRPPFEGDTSMNIMFQHISEQPPPIEEFVDPGDVPAELIRLVKGMMAKRIVERPESALDVRERLQQIQRETQYEPVVLESDDADAFDEWLLPRRESDRETAEADPAPQTAGDAGSPSTADVARAHTMDSPQHAEAPADDPTASPASNEAPEVTYDTGRSPMVWVGLGAVAMILFIGGAVGTWSLMSGSGSAAAAGSAGGDAASKARAATPDTSQPQKRAAGSREDAGAAGARAGAGSPGDDAGAATGRTGSPAEARAGGSAGSEKPDEPAGDSPSAGASDDDRADDDRAGASAKAGSGDSSGSAGADEPPSTGEDRHEETTAEPTQEDDSDESSGSTTDDIATPDFARSGSSEESSGEKESGGGSSGEDSDAGGFFTVE